MDTKKLKERLVADGEKAIEAQLANTKRRGRKPRAKKKEEPAIIDMGEIPTTSAKAESLLKSCINSDNRQNAIRIIEEEIGKEQLIRLAVKYLYNSIVEVKNA